MNQCAREVIENLKQYYITAQNQAAVRSIHKFRDIPFIFDTPTFNAIAVDTVRINNVIAIVETRLTAIGGALQLSSPITV